MSFGQTIEGVRYYEATTASGNPAPKPDPWCELTQFGSRNLWACPTMKMMNRDAGDSNSHGGGSGGGGGMGGGGGGGGMDSD